MICKLNKKFGQNNLPRFQVRHCFLQGHVKNDVFLSQVHRLDIGARAPVAGQEDDTNQQANQSNDIFSQDIFFKSTIQVYAPQKESHGLSLSLFEIASHHS